ncbi:MAG: RNA ligase (ATP), partial [Kiritimatiellae bacterium]|nr:RNA ligase (ATP) [Kiritimatiellia bacterium]
MARKLASVVKIASVSSIPEADRLEVIEMDGKGWRVVTSKGEFQPGDLAVYFEIDSFLPSDDERYAFLRERCLRKFCSKGGSVLREGLRIKTAKLRGVISQGLVMPIAKFPELIGPDGSPPEIGFDATAALNVEHYDEVAEAMRPAQGGIGASDVMGSFPGFIPKTDEERIQ